jgi:hypothetical protein
LWGKKYFLGDFFRGKKNTFWGIFDLTAPRFSTLLHCSWLEEKKILLPSQTPLGPWIIFPQF